MKTVAIIVEYNPFHNGHLYQINKVKQETNADCIVVIMSGNYVQRGTPAIIDKYARTQLALLNGVDLVFELPVYYATASAELFAYGAVNILNRLGIVDYLCFGSECGDIELLNNIATVLLEEPKDFKLYLKMYLKKGLSFPVARKQALIDFLGKDQTLEFVLNEPNNILGIEYIKALKKLDSTMKPITITRHGSGYHDKDLDNPFCSATALRNYYESLAKSNHLSKESNVLGSNVLGSNVLDSNVLGSNVLETNVLEADILISAKTVKKLPAIDPFIPSTTKECLEHSYNRTFPMTVDDFTSLLYYRLLQESSESLQSYLDVNEDLANRILKEVNYHMNFSNLIEHTKTKQFTYTRISRTLLHILLQIKKEDMNTFLLSPDSAYARLLGFQASAGIQLKRIKKNDRIPVITKVANADKILSPIAIKCFQTDIKATHLYNQIVYSKFNTILPSEFTTGPIIKK